MTPRVRYILLGVGGIALAVVLGLLVALALRAVNAGTDSRVDPAAPAPAVTAPAAASSEPSSTAPVRPDPRKNECVDDLGDAVLDLDSVLLNLDGGDLIVRFTLAGDLPEGGTSLGLHAERSADRAYEFGVDLRDGVVDRVFVKDLEKSDVDELDTDDVRVEGGVVTAVFPKSSIKRLGNDWSWYATASQSGGPADACPGTASGPVLLQFER